MVNLGEVNFIDSFGLIFLVVGMWDVDKGKGSFCICNVYLEVKLVFEVIMMDFVFEIFEIEDEVFNFDDVCN